MLKHDLLLRSELRVFAMVHALAGQREQVCSRLVRLAQWPAVSGMKRLRGKLAGSYRIRTGDYRIVFRIEEQTENDARVVIWKIGYRGDVYD